MLTTLHVEIRGLRGLLDDFAAQMDSGIPYERTELLARRMDFSRRFQTYLALLDALSTNPFASAVALTSSRAIRLLQFDYSAHLQHWTPCEIDADWTGYCGSVRAIQASLHALFDAQERELVPLLRRTRIAA